MKTLRFLYILLAVASMYACNKLEVVPVKNTTSLRFSTTDTDTTHIDTAWVAITQPDSTDTFMAGSRFDVYWQSHGISEQASVTAHILNSKQGTHTTALLIANMAGDTVITNGQATVTDTALHHANHHLEYVMPPGGNGLEGIEAMGRVYQVKIAIIDSGKTITAISKKFVIKPKGR